MSLVVRIIAPTGRDAALISMVLARNGVLAEPISGSMLFEERGGEPIGPLLVAEEALSPTLSERLRILVQQQPTWSDLPILVLTARGRDTSQLSGVNGVRFPMGAVLLERPIQPVSLVSSVQAALRARARQYEIRDAVMQLREERETLQAVLDNLPTGVWLTKPTGEVVLRNRFVSERFPVLANKDGDSPWPVYTAGGQQVAWEASPLYRAMQTRIAVPPQEFLYERGPGVRHWISVAAAPMLNAAGEITGGVAAVSDIDHQKRAELALIQNEKLAAVGRLAASISHEINNPLEAVTNLLYLARQTGGISDVVDGYLAVADTELARVSQIVSHTLRFHRQSTNPRVLSPKELLGPTLGLYSGRLVNSGIGVTLKDNGEDKVTCYEGEIRQVLNNLVGNAMESMKNGGRLVVRTADTYMWRTGERAVRITIADTGHGMPEEVAQRAFDAFYTTKGINGTGLGLWISRGIVEKHGGLLQVRSSVRPDRTGTAFSMLLPLDAFGGAAVREP